MDVTIETLWKRYVDAEVDRIRPVYMAVLGDFIDALLAQPQEEWHAWAKHFAAQVSDDAVEAPIRMPLFRSVLLPALASGVLMKEAGCARWLAVHEGLLAHCELSDLPENLRTPVDLLREAVRIDPSDTLARQRLVEKDAWFLDYTLHELPDFVLNCATAPQCQYLLALVDEFESNVHVLGLEERYGDLIGECRWHYAAYTEYIASHANEGSYEEFTRRRRIRR